MPILNEPLRDLTAWTSHFRGAVIPVLRRTCAQLDELREREDELHASDIAAVVYRDPLMTLKVLAHVSKTIRRGHEGEIETVEQAVVMMGMSPFFRAFQKMPTVENHLHAYPMALLGLMRVVARASRSAHYARDWAVRRQDLDWEVIVVASLLHDFAEMLLWCFAPELALKIRDVQLANPKARSTTTQKALLNIELNDLEQHLMQAWMLPKLVVKMTDDRHADHPQVRNVVCAVNLARHSANGWDDAALPDDFRAIGELLRMSPDAVKKLILPSAESTAA